MGISPADWWEMAKLARRNVIRDFAKDYPEFSTENIACIWEDYDRRRGKWRERWWERHGPHG